MRWLFVPFSSLFLLSGFAVDAPDTSAQELPKAAICLHSRDAVVHGEKLRYEPEPNKNTLGYWVNAGDWAEWHFHLAAPAQFQVQVLQGCGKGSGGAEVEFAVGEQVLKMVVEDTGHFQNFVAREIGALKLPAGDHTLTVVARSKPGPAVMDLRQILLLPAAPAAPR